VTDGLCGHADKNAGRRLQDVRGKAEEVDGKPRMMLCKMSTSVYDIALRKIRFFDRRMAE